MGNHWKKICQSYPGVKVTPLYLSSGSGFRNRLWLCQIQRKWPITSKHDTGDRMGKSTGVAGCNRINILDKGLPVTRVKPGTAASTTLY